MLCAFYHLQGTKGNLQVSLAYLVQRVSQGALDIQVQLCTFLIKTKKSKFGLKNSTITLSSQLAMVVSVFIIFSLHSLRYLSEGLCISTGLGGHQDCTPATHHLFSTMAPMTQDVNTHFPRCPDFGRVKNDYCKQLKFGLFCKSITKNDTLTIATQLTTAAGCHSSPFFPTQKSIGEGLPWASSGQDSALPLQGARVRSLVKELRSHKP